MRACLDVKRAIIASSNVKKEVEHLVRKMKGLKNVKDKRGIGPVVET